MTTDLRGQLQQALGSAYTLDRELGGGGMSRVFVATEHALGRQVVVKVLPTEMAGQVPVDRFKREISLAARLQRPHIVPLLTAGDAGGLPSTDAGPKMKRAAERALMLDSANAMAGIFYASSLRDAGLITDSVKLADSSRALRQRTMRLNPLSFNVWNSNMPGTAAIGLLSIDSATALCKTAARINDGLAATCQARRRLAARDYRAAADAFRRLAGTAPSGRDFSQLAQRLLDARDTAGARDALKRAVERSRTEYVREDVIANAFLRLGDRERANEWMVKAGASNAAGIGFLESDPSFAPILSDPRIQAVIKRIKQPQ